MIQEKTPIISMISGVTGQDGSYLAEILLRKGHKVIGLKRRTSVINTSRIDHLYNDPMFKLEYFDLSDAGCIYRLLNIYKPDFFYNLAAQSHVKVSFELSQFTTDTIVMGTLRILDAIREISPHTKFYQASSSEMFGDNPILPLNEQSILSPASPYACAKVFAHNLIRNYRKSYDLFACSGILMNHESPRRGETFVTRKITIGAALIKCGIETEIQLGNLDAKRDWGFAKEYMEAAYLMMQQNEPDDYVISTGESHSIRDFLQYVFEHAGLGDYEQYVKINEKFFRPHEVPHLLGQSDYAQKKLGWEPKIKCKELARMMYESDLKFVKEKYKIK